MIEIMELIIDTLWNFIKEHKMAIEVIGLIMGIIYTSFKIRDFWRRRNKEKIAERLLKAGGVDY